MAVMAQRVTLPVERGNLTSLNEKMWLPLSRETLRDLAVPADGNPAAAAPGGTAYSPSPAAPPASPAAYTPAPAAPQASPMAYNPAPSPAPIRPTAYAPAPAPAPAHPAAYTPAPAPPPARPVPVPPAPAPAASGFPPPVRLLQKGQKTPLSGRTRLRIAIDWLVRDARCDVDVSAFFLDASGRVPNEGWFVFYSQTRSPDGSFSLHTVPGGVWFDGDLGRLPPAITKVVFVMTIHEALERGLHFGMLARPCIRLLDGADGRELAAYCPEELYNTVTSMSLGELYRYKGDWRFNPVGNGVKTDLAGQCALYGLQTV